MPAITVEQGFILDSGAGFTDGNGERCTNLDVVEYRYGKRRGILFDCTGDGDAYVAFRDTRRVEIVKWKHLCKVPEFASVEA